VDFVRYAIVRLYAVRALLVVGIARHCGSLGRSVPGRRGGGGCGGSAW
jgi:hypothetical protein